MSIDAQGAEDLTLVAEHLVTRLESVYARQNAKRVHASPQELLPATPEQMLKVIVYCTGRLPDFVVERPPGTLKASQYLANYREVMTSGMEWEEFKERRDALEGTMQLAPYHVYRTALKSDQLPSKGAVPGKVSPAFAIYQATEIRDADISNLPAHDPLLELASLHALTTRQVLDPDDLDRLHAAITQEPSLMRYVGAMLDSQHLCQYSGKASAFRDDPSVAKRRDAALGTREA